MNEKCKSAVLLRLKPIKIILAFTVAVIAIVNSSPLSDAIISGARLALFSILPSLFPMFVISDFLCAEPISARDGIATRIFEKAFGISAIGIRAFLCGNLCGFPIGATCCGELMRDGLIDKDECESLIGICSCPSAAFVISGVGLGICRSAKDGVILYLSLIASAVVCGVLNKEKREFSRNSHIIAGQKFDLSDSIKSAAVRSINVCAHIAFFSAILSFVDLAIKSPFIRALISIPLEIGNASKRLSQLTFSSPHIQFALIGLTLGFSGICVLMQIRSVIPSFVSTRKYVKMKIEQGMICGALSLLCSIIFR